MNRIGKLGGIGLALALSLMLIGWAQSFPVSLTSIHERNLEQMSILFWIGFFMAYPMLFLLGIQRSATLRAVSCVLLIFLLTAPKLLYLQTGSDTETFVGLLDLFDGVHLSTYGEQTYAQWPVLTMWGRLLQLYCGCDSAVVYLLFWAAMIVGLGLAGFLLYSRGSTSNPADFLGLYLLISILLWLWDWQVSAYNLALIFSLALIALLPYEHWAYRLLATLLFGTLAFSHGLVPIWILAIVLTISLLKWLNLSPSRVVTLWRNRTAQRPDWHWLFRGRARSWFMFFGVLALIQGTVMVFHSSRLIRRIVLIVQDYYTAILEEQLSGNTVARYASMAATVPVDRFDTITKWLAWLDLGLNALLIVLCFAALLWGWRRAAVRDWTVILAVFLIGCAHYVVGNFMPILGTRALNIILILPMYGVYLLLETTNLRRWVIGLLFVAFSLYPVNLMRLQMTHTQYNTEESFRALRYILPQLERDFMGGDEGLKVLADQSQYHYLRVALPRFSLFGINYRGGRSAHMEFPLHPR